MKNEAESQAVFAVSYVRNVRGCTMLLDSTVYHIHKATVQKLDLCKYEACLVNENKTCQLPFSFRKKCSTLMTLIRKYCLMRSIVHSIMQLSFATMAPSGMGKSGNILTFFIAKFRYMPSSAEIIC